MNQGLPVNLVNGNSQVSRLQLQLYQQHLAQGQHQQQHSSVNQSVHQLQHQQQHPLQHLQVQQQQQQQQQQQRQLTQQQLQRQRHQLLFQRLENYTFAETSEDLLAKYASLPPSLEFHIYDNHYRFGQQDGIIPKSSPLGKEFLRYILKEEIPDSLVEVIKDSGIQLYEGSLILQVIDHRDMVEKIVKTENEEVRTKTPKSYRTILRPVQLSIYADLLYQTDSLQLRLSDQSSLLLELEILTLTKRNIDLTVPLNPYHCNDYLIPEIETTHYNPEQDLVIHTHRNNDSMYKYKPLHEDSITNHHNQSEYEQMMSLFSENFRSSNNSVNLMNESSNSKSSQFVRWRFIENYRRKLERMKLAGIATNMQTKISGDMTSGVGGTGVGAISSMLGLTPQQRLLIQQQRMIQQQQKTQMSNALNGGTVGNSPLNKQQSPGVNGVPPTNGTEKKKPLTKRPRKQPTKKQQLALLLALLLAGLNLNDSAVSTPESGEPLVKKKRGTYKKKNKPLALETQSSPPQQQVPNNIMDMNFNITGGFPQ